MYPLLTEITHTGTSLSQPTMFSACLSQRCWSLRAAAARSGEESGARWRR